jgi:hypothetical protein
MDAEQGSSPHETEQASFTATETIVSLFQPDTLLSEQYFADRRRKTLLQPEKKLMLAILEDAVDFFQEHHWARCGEGKRFFDEAQKWIFGGDDWVFGFENICGVLGYDPEYIRVGLTRWREKQFSKHHSAAL